MAQYKRILLKLSGESLMGGKQYGIDEVRLNEYATQIKEIAKMGVQIGIVIGGGNIFRGLSGASKGKRRSDEPERRRLGQSRICCRPRSSGCRAGKEKK